MRAIERCRYYAAADAIERARREGHTPQSVTVDGKVYDIERVDRFIARERSKMPKQLPGFLNNKLMRWMGVNAAALQHAGPDPGGEIGDEAEQRLAKMRIGKWEIGKWMLAAIQYDFEKVAHHAKVEVSLENGAVQASEGEAVDRRTTFYLELVGASLAAIAGGIAAVPPIPPPAAIVTLSSLAAVLAAGSLGAAAKLDLKLALTLLSMAGKAALLGVIGELDIVGVPVCTAIVAFDVGAAARQLEPPTVTDMNSLHKHVQS